MSAAALRQRISEQEWAQRVNLAACYRLVALYGWDDLVFTHISARVPGRHDAFLVNRYGDLFEEVTASSLVKVDLEGRILEGEGPVNPAGFIIHSAIHEARQDAECVIHLHSRAGVAVAAQAEGLLPISQISLFPLASLAYHDYEGVALNPEEKARLVADLGQCGAMLLRNHGTLALGPSIADAFLLMYTLERACETQVLAQAGGGALRHVPEPILAGIQAQAAEATGGLGGELAGPALLRRLNPLDPSYQH
ncbi:MAG: class II aldolase/adducin family protein [Gammaproteobacteria bacterium]|nr:class II aldolase/adducin family protein [Gammaproteobacteria bacterium]